MNTLNWWLGWAFDDSNGKVMDTITGPDCQVTGEGWWTYNSGAFLFGIADLFYTTGDEKILELGRSIAYAGMRDFSNPETGVLTESCEDDPPPAEGKPPGCQQDETLVCCLASFVFSLSLGAVLIPPFAAALPRRRNSSKASSCSVSRNSTSLDQIPTSTISSTPNS
jgi:hypothetical protein